ncbi:hypothetical protein BME96_12595 [Virgibacillus halodenitrificans]|uniref:Uncharacterized protein n=1 Tax=Virgibacillus halodenitrificans TaxID=1482 RepID=A0AAC9J1V5_VIRHA|nr:hypothetical protein [Virgibacillus halodenitrificans]APC48978.1 hypothetical protein BME96_12595 [Virgibacillus halodenitrificans]
MRVLVPKKVAEALDYHKEICKGMSPDTIDMILMSIPFSTVHGHALVLKQFAKQKPTLYLQAIANDYEPIVDIEEEVEQMLTDWLNKKYVDDEKTDVKNFARVVTNHIKQKL